MREAHLAGAAEEQAGDGLLDALSPKDLRCDARLNQVDNIGPCSILPELCFLLCPAHAAW